MLYNFVAITLIFTIFGIIILNQVQSTLYTKVDEELQGYMNRMGGAVPNNDDFPPNPRNRIRPPMPGMIILLWNESGEIVNQGQIGTQYYENYLKDIKLVKENLGIIQTLTIDNMYDFRTISFLSPNNNEDGIYMIQLLVNVDAEQTVIGNFESILIFCSIIFILLTITVSYVLSKKTMKPIMNSWQKQVEFVEDASHELRTPLTIVQNKLELLLTTPNEKIIDKFENIALSLSETRRLSKLTTDLLTLARADSTETEFVKKSIDVDEFVHHACTPYVEIAQSQKKNLWMKLNCKVQMEADANRLHQLLVILIDNSLKYTGENDSIGVKTSYVDHRVVIEISDTGMGIREENLSHIFDRFYREDQARTREKGGFGLGLSIAQWIVAGHQGTIRVRNNEHKGTTFTIKLPK